jgi:hypothetical protein
LELPLSEIEKTREEKIKREEEFCLGLVKYEMLTKC